MIVNTDFFHFFVYFLCTIQRNKEEESEQFKFSKQKYETGDRTV